MTQRTRYFLLGSALVLMVGLGTGLVAFYNGNMPSRGSSAGPSELSYLPQASVGVAFADVHSIMNSEFRQKLRQVLPTGEAKDEFLKETGIDIERDIDTVVAGFVPTADGSSPEKGAVVIIRGRFDAQQIEALGNQHGATIETYGGKKLMLFATGQHTEAGADSMALSHVPAVGAHGGVAFLEPGLIAVGTTVALKQAVDAGAGSANVTANADLMKFIAEVANGGNAWVVGEFDAITRNANLPAQVTEHIPPVQWFALNVNVNGGVSGVVRAETRDDQAAEQLRDVIRGGLAAARLVSGNDPRADAIVNSLQVTGTGKNVSLAFSLPGEMLDMINGVAGLGNLNHENERPKTRIAR